MLCLRAKVSLHTTGITWEGPVGVITEEQGSMIGYNTTLVWRVLNVGQEFFVYKKVVNAGVSSMNKEEKKRVLFD